MKALAPSKWGLVVAILVLVAFFSMQDSPADAAQGSEYHVTNAHMRSGGISDWYQGGYADCSAYHNVCWFDVIWYDWNGSSFLYIGTNSHSIPSGAANWHSSSPGCPYRFVGGSECWVWDHHDSSYETPPSHAVSPRFTGCKNWKADVRAENYAGQTLDRDNVFAWAYACAS